MKYEKAKAEVVLFDNSDVITATGDLCDGTSANGLANCDWAHENHGNHGNKG